MLQRFSQCQGSQGFLHILNGLTCFIIVLTFCFGISNIEAAVNNPTGQPYIQALFSATESRAGGTVMAVILIVMTLWSTIGNVAIASRQMFACAHDRGLPFASFLSHVSTCHETIQNPLFNYC